MYLLESDNKKINYTVAHFIRASVDALCRDETDEISRDPHT